MTKGITSDPIVFALLQEFKMWEFEEVGHSPKLNQYYNLIALETSTQSALEINFTLFVFGPS